LDRVANAGFSVAGPAVLPDADRISPLEAAAGVPPGTPVLVLAGGADRHATPDEARAIADRLGPAAELVVIDAAGHLVLDRPGPLPLRQHAHLPLGHRLALVADRPGDRPRLPPAAPGRDQPAERARQHGRPAAGERPTHRTASGKWNEPTRAGPHRVPPGRG